MRKTWFRVTMVLVGAIYFGLLFFSISISDLDTIRSQYQSFDLVKRTEILRTFTEAVAIVFAGIWTYELYIKNRYDHPYPKIQHQADDYDLGNGFVYLSVFVTVTNEGKTKLDLGVGKIYIRKVLPLSANINELLLTKYPMENVRTGRNLDQTSIFQPKKKFLLFWHFETKNIKSEPSKDHLFLHQGQRVGWITLGEREWETNLRGTMHELEPGQTREIQFDFIIKKGEADVVEVLTYIGYEKSIWEHVTIYSLKGNKNEKSSSSQETRHYQNRHKSANINNQAKTTSA
jgi:hypothetical protein